MSKIDPAAHHDTIPGWLRKPRYYIGGLIIAQALLALVYVFMHTSVVHCIHIPGETTMKLSGEQRQVVYSILDGDTTRSEQASLPAVAEMAETASDEPASGGAAITAAVTTASEPTPRGIEYRRLTTIKMYLRMVVEDWVEQDRKDKLSFLDHLDRGAMRSYLENTRFRVFSFFWLKGWYALLEVFFWTIFGVICSIHFRIYEAKSKYNEEHPIDYGAEVVPMGRGFDPREVVNHHLKLAYAPFISIIIILGYEFFATDGFTDVIDTSQGVVIIAFMLGFYSPRALRMLEKIRDVLLPYGATGDVSVSSTLKETQGPGRRTSLTVQLRLSPDVATKYPEQAEEMANELDAAEVRLLPLDGGEVLLAERTGNEQDALFLGNVSTGAYAVEAARSTARGINLRGKATVNTVTERAVEVLMAEEEVSG